MNKPFYILLSFAFLLFSCNSKEKQAQVLIGVSQCSDDLWRTTMNNELLLEASLNKRMDVIIKTVKDDTEQQIKDIKQLIADKIDLLVVSPNESKALTPIIQQAYNSGIPVILVDRKIDSSDYTAYIGADNFQIGKEAALYVSNVLNDRGNVVIIRGFSGSTSDAERYQGFIDVLSKYKNIEVVAERRGDFLPYIAQQKMERVIRENKQIDLVFAFNDAMAHGVYNAYSKYSGKRPIIVGIDALPGHGGGIEKIKNGIIDASFIYPTGGDKVIELAESILANKRVNKENFLLTTVVDKSNVRVLQLQTEQINEHQLKIMRVNSRLDESLDRYTSQQSLFYFTILVLLLTFIILLILINSYRAKNRANQLLEERKNQLISLSEELEEATNAKLMFFTNISHEFRTPLTLILGPVDTLLDSSNLDSEQLKLLSLVKRNSNTLLNLISQIIEFRTYENGKLQLHLTKTNLKELIDTLNPPLIDYANRLHQQLNIDLDDSVELLIDQEKFERIYFNLLSNAFKFTKSGKNINVALTKKRVNDEEFAVITVMNETKMVDEEALKSIFERFYKVSQTDAGTGIGLALTKTLIEAHGGTISVENVENGLCFTVHLPINEGSSLESESILENEGGFISLQLSNINTTLESEEFTRTAIDKELPIVLIIEDNRDMRRFMTLVLDKQYNIIEAVDGDEGIEMALKYIPDIIISDVMMPNKDGFEVCKILKENVITSHIPIILLTACSLDEQKSIGFESGADAYIAKPFNADILKIRIRKLIENRLKLIKAFGNSILTDEQSLSVGEGEQEYLNKVKKYVQSNISSSELTVDSLALHLGVSNSQLYRKIKYLTDYSPNALIRVIRLKYAKQLLAHADVNVSDVAYKSGFSSLSYFSKCFKDQYKLTPTEYLSQLK